MVIFAWLLEEDFAFIGKEIVKKHADKNYKKDNQT